MYSVEKIEAVNKRKTEVQFFFFYVAYYNIIFNSNLTHKDFATGIYLMLPVTVIKYSVHNLLSWTYGSWSSAGVGGAGGNLRVGLRRR